MTLLVSDHVGTKELSMFVFENIELGFSYDTTDLSLVLGKQENFLFSFSSITQKVRK